MEWNERTLQDQFAQWRYRQGFVLPNYAPAKWFECDIFQVTDAGYFVEYEIKVSRSDFRADAKKIAEKWGYTIGPDGQRRFGKIADGLSKHDRLAAHDIEGPSRFYYLTPPGLIEPCELPPFAGLCVPIASYPGTEIVVKAPKLHGEKLREAVLEHARSVLYYRFWNLRIDTSEQRRQEMEPAEAKETA